MIYDCFIMLNELPLLDLRLNELYDAVDYFVIVEANKTFSYKDKPFHFRETEERWKQFVDKIIYVPVADMPLDPYRWNAEFHQRNAIMHGLVNAQPDDIILMSDIDEIWDKNKLEFDQYPYTFEQMPMRGYLNTIQPLSTWFGTHVIKRDMLTESCTPQEWRTRKNHIRKVQGGWHFSFQGGPKQVYYKIESFSHHENDTENIKNVRVREIEELINLEVIPLDARLPAYLRNNADKFREMIRA